MPISQCAPGNGEFQTSLHAGGERRRGDELSATARNFRPRPKPDLILLDLGLPKKDGREVLSEIRADENLKEIPVVVLTGSTDEADVAHTQMLSVESYLVKPVNLTNFLEVIRELKRFWFQDVILPAVE